MESYRSYLQSIKDRHHSLEELIQGTVPSRVFGEFVGASALFPILDAIRTITTEGLMPYFSEPSHYVLFAAAFIQAWFFGTVKTITWKTSFAGSLLGFGLYAPFDLLLEGIEFFYEPYHILFGVYSLMIAVLRAMQTVTQGMEVWQTVTTLLLNVGKLLLFPAMYIIIELNLERTSQLVGLGRPRFMETSAHSFFFYGALFFGILLGLAEFQRVRNAQFLRYLARQLKKYTEWSLGSELTQDAIDNPHSLELHRVERSILFMDIREFTAWTETADPQQAVDMLNSYYKLADTIINDHHGHKPTFTADEVMTRFPTADVAVQTALELQIELTPLMREYGLSVGIGLHTGEVIEGMMGSDDTRKYDIIGDAVNTAKRLESCAGKGEIVISESTYLSLSVLPRHATMKILSLKGKKVALKVYALSNRGHIGRDSMR